MDKNIFSLSNNSYKKRNKFKYILYIVPLVLILALVIYLIVSYKLLFNNFTTNFNKNNFSSANTILITKGNFNPLKSIYLENDLKKYFNNIVKDIPKNINNNNLNKNQAINIISEIERYNFININTDSLLKSLKYEDPYKYGLTLYDSKKYKEAYNVFLTVPSSSPYYNKSLTYINNCKANIKSSILQQANDLCINNYYTKALDLIDTVNDILGTDKDIVEKINEIQQQKNEFIAKKDGDTLETSSLVVNNLSSSNINTLSIDSLTSYLVHVDLTKQKTYVYNGVKNKWSLLKTFDCSTGIKGSETPEGIFTIKDKGNWFYSDTYNQGAKYWVQFSGNYLFHSLPYNKDQSKIVDYTLGVPASHGCVRLPVDDSKWLYDNVPTNTKVIIK